MTYQDQLREVVLYNGEGKPETHYEVIATGNVCCAEKLRAEAKSTFEKLRYAKARAEHWWIDDKGNSWFR